MKRTFSLLLLVVFAIAVDAQNEGFVMPSLAPVVQKDATILFKLRAPAARQVFVKVENNLIPMQKSKAGVWSGVSGKMEPDIYSYTFLVDSLSIVDPSNSLMRSSYGGTGSSLITVPGNQPQPWELQHVPHGAVTQELFHSSVINDDRNFYVYTPPGYNAKENKEYPVLYLLHGMGDDARGWFQTGAANLMLDNLIAEGKVVPMILVTTLGYGVAGTVMSPKSFEQFTKIAYR